MLIGLFFTCRLSIWALQTHLPRRQMPLAVEATLAKQYRPELESGSAVTRPIATKFTARKKLRFFLLRAEYLGKLASPTRWSPKLSVISCRLSPVGYLPYHNSCQLSSFAPLLPCSAQNDYDPSGCLASQNESHYPTVTSSCQIP